MLSDLTLAPDCIPLRARLRVLLLMDLVALGLRGPLQPFPTVKEGCDGVDARFQLPPRSPPNAAPTSVATGPRQKCSVHKVSG